MYSTIKELKDAFDRKDIVFEDIFFYATTDNGIMMEVRAIKKGEKNQDVVFYQNIFEVTNRYEEDNYIGDALKKYFSCE